MRDTINPMSSSFWSRLDSFLESGHVVIDRRAQSHHPRFPLMIYPLDYGYLEPVTGGDGVPIDVWRGSLPDTALVGIVCTVDSMKHDGEHKLLLGCTSEEIATIEQFHTSECTS